MATAELLLLGAACGPVGVWVLVYRQAFATESMSHGMLPGLVVGVAIGAPLFLGAVAGGALAAATNAIVARTPRIGPDVATAVSVGALLGVGELLAVATGVPEHLEDLLFGDPLTAGATDVAAAALLAVAVAVGATAGHRSLTVAAFDRSGAPALGVAPARVDLLLLAGLALTAAVAARGVGALLVLALVVGPAAAATTLGGSLRARLVAASAIGAAVGWSDWSSHASSSCRAAEWSPCARSPRRSRRRSWRRSAACRPRREGGAARGAAGVRVPAARNGLH